jgi:hypothetical protein
MSSTVSSFMLGLRVLYKARPIQANPTIPTTTTALTWIFIAQDTTTNNGAPTVPAIIACICCVTFVDVFQQQHCQIHYQDTVLFPQKGVFISILSSFAAFTYSLLNVKISAVFINILM